jgi:hypothetical protein
LQSADQDVTIVPVPITTPYSIRKGRPWWQQFQPTDPSGLELPDQDVTFVPWTPDPADYLRWRGRGQWAQYTPTDLTPFTPGLPDQDVTFWPVLRRVWYPPSRAPYQQYHPTDPSSLELADYDINFLPWSQDTADYQRWQGRGQWKQYTPTDLTPFTPGLPDQDVTFWPVVRRVWYPPSRAPFQQYRPTDPSSLELADFDITFLPWTPDNADYQRWTGRGQWKQYTPVDLTPFAPTLPDQDVNLVPWTPATAEYQRYRGREQWSQWPVLPRDVNPLLSADQDVRLVPVPITTVYGIRHGKQYWYQLPLRLDPSMLPQIPLVPTPGFVTVSRDGAVTVWIDAAATISRDPRTTQGEP